MDQQPQPQPQPQATTPHRPQTHAVAPLVEAGQVRFARKADSLVEELLAFSPRGGIDDQVDAFTQGVLWIEAQYWRGRGHSSAPLPMVFSR